MKIGIAGIRPLLAAVTNNTFNGKRAGDIWKRELLYVPLAVLAYSLTLHWVYANLVTGAFAYLGYRYSPPTPWIAVLSWIIVVGVAISLPKRIVRPSSIVLWLLFLIAAAPGMLMAGYVGFLSDIDALSTSFLLGLSFLIVSLGVRRCQPTKPLTLPFSQTTFWIAIAVFSFVTYGLMLFTVGISIQFVAILDVYDVREQYSAALAGAGVLGYLISTQANVINPLIIVRGLYSKRWGLVALGVAGQGLLYSTTGFKTILFSVPALIIVALIFRFNLRPNPLMLLWGATLMMVGSAAMDYIVNSNIWTSLFSRRFILTPGLLTAAYIAFFSESPKALLGYSVLAPWVEYDYDFAPPKVIGQWVTGSPLTAMNVNIFADGFANFGWLGMLGAAIVLLIYLRVLDRAAHGLPAAVSALVILMPTIAMSNASILTSMFSHGLVVAVVFLVLAPRGGWGGRKPGNTPRRRPQFLRWRRSRHTPILD